MCSNAVSFKINNNICLETVSNGLFSRKYGVVLGLRRITFQQGHMEILSPFQWDRRLTNLRHCSDYLLNGMHLQVYM